MAGSRKTRPSCLLDEEGATAAEYAIMLALIVGIAIAGIAALGASTSRLWSTDLTKVSATSGS